MNRSSGFFLLLLALSSCDSEKKNNDHIGLKTTALENANQTKPTTAHAVRNEVIPASKSPVTPFEAGMPEITPLPFGLQPSRLNFHYEESYFIRLLSQNKSDKTYSHFELPPPPKHKVYRLPTIRSIEYFPLPIATWVDTGSCYDGKPFSRYIKLKGYQYRLPDVYYYHCYYWSGSRYYNDKEYSDRVRRNCQVFLPDYKYGYFILYDPKSMTAKAFTIYFDTEYDWLYIYRFFYIDKSYHIKVYENSASLEGDGKPPYPYKITRFSILPNGKIKIERH
jgi:hypothetical protein